MADDALSRLVRDPERLAAVRRTALLDTTPEESFDRLTRLAAKLVGAPVTFISLVDEGRDFYKSCYGFGEPLAATREMEGTTFCHYSIAGDQPLAIPDTLADPVYRQVPTVESLGVRAYLGIPLVASDGYVIGSFCAADFAPREWRREEVEIVTELAASAMREIELRLLYREEERQRREKEAAEEALRATLASRSRFFAAMSHELRTPINAVIGYNDLLLSGVYGPLSEPQQQGIERSQRAAKHLLELVNDVLDLSKLEAGKIELEMEEVKIATLIDDLFTTIGPLAEEHGYELLLESEPCSDTLRTDPRRVRQILLNLLSNALKFGEGKPIRVRCAGIPEHGLRVEVIDQGRGIAPEDQEKIFEEFVQGPGADDNPTGQSGTGLGLAISRRLARLLGGTLEVESAPGEGSTFRLTLPDLPPAR